MTTALQTNFYDDNKGGTHKRLMLARETIASLGRQTDQDFDVLCPATPWMHTEIQSLFNQLAPEIPRNNRLRMKKLVKGDTRVRQIDNLFANEVGLEWAINEDIGRYNLVWKVDGDDIYADNCHEAGKRVQQQTEAVIVGIDQREFYGNTEQSISLIAPRHDNRAPVKKENIRHSNRFGFGSTFFDPNAVRDIAPNNHIGLSNLAPIFNGPIDWIFYTPLILADAKAVYTDETHVFYRQHAQNELGNNQKGPEHSIRAKAIFYPEVISRGNLSEGDQAIYQKLANVFRDQVRILDDPKLLPLRDILMQANATIKHGSRFPLEWWEDAQPIDFSESLPKLEAA